MDKTIKLISWNVNGIRAVINKNMFYPWVQRENPDIFCLQETKARPEQVTIDLPGYHAYWNSAEKAGYSGTAIFTKVKPISVAYGLGMPHHDKEGRVISHEYPDFYLVNVYTPNTKRDLSRLSYRTREWDRDFLLYLKNLEKKKPVIFCGDLNVAHKEIDLANPATNHHNAGFTNEERQSFDNIVEAGFLDTFRELSNEGGHYSWWSFMTRARERNIGWRIDYFCISASLRPRLKTAQIHPDVFGSDHCPVSVTLSA